jgi:hypothetical protein
MKVAVEKAAKLGMVGFCFFSSFPFLACYLFALISLSIFAFYYLETPLRKALIARLSRRVSTS